jgi:DHA1 family multidrug resistance protein-like MFS transporter
MIEVLSTLLTVLLAFLFAAPMYHRLTAKWALTLLALLSLVFCSIPFFFYRYGRRIREWSRYAPAED